MFNTESGTQDAIALIPAGTLTKAVLICEEVKTSQNTGAQFVKIELRCIEGDFEGRRIFDNIMDPFDPNASAGGKRMGIQAITRICEAVGIFNPEDPTTYDRYSHEGCTIHDVIADIESQTVAVKVKVEKGDAGYSDKNKVGDWLSPNPKAGPGYKGWTDLAEGKTGGPAPAAAKPLFGAGGAKPAGAAAGGPGSWKSSMPKP